MVGVIERGTNADKFLNFWMYWKTMFGFEGNRETFVDETMSDEKNKKMK